MPATDSVHTLADLPFWSYAGTSLAVLGHPIKHSVSPAMHNAALAELAASDPRFANWRYFKFDIEPVNLPEALRLFHEKKFLGLNLTVPHKVMALPHVAKVDEAAQAAGAVNTLVWQPVGYAGFNTDGPGLAAALRANLGRDLTGAHIFLIGAGGAARGVAAECLRRRCASLWIANRTRKNLDALLIELAQLTGDIPVCGFDPDAPASHLPAGAIVINATSLGLRPGDHSPIDLEKLPRPAAVYDMIYNPPLTPLLTQATALGIPHANGLGMLVHQGALALEHWTGRPAPVATMRAAAEACVKK